MENRIYFENAAVGFLVVDSAQSIVRVNRMFCQLSGYTPDELVGSHTARLHISEAHYERCFGGVLQQATKGEIVRSKYPMRKKNGEVIWVSVTGAPIEKDGSVFDGVIWTVTDVSEEVQALEMVEQLNAELKQSNVFLNSMINVAPIPIYVKDESLRYRECNAAFLTLAGVDEKEIIGKTAAEVFSEEIADSIDQTDMMLRDGAYQHYSQSVVFNGRHYHMEFHKVAIYVEGAFRGVVGVVIDITDHVKREMRLKQKIQDEVDKNVQLEKDHFEVRLADAKFAIIGKLAAGITHEINTPLTYIKGNAEMLEFELAALAEPERLAPAEYSRAQILEGVSRIRNIVTSMREVSQQQSEKSVRINLCESLIIALTMAYSRSKHIVNVTVQHEPFALGFDRNRWRCDIIAQRQRLEQVWIVIINNALDQLEQNGSFEANRLDILCECSERDITVCFKDNGGGIDESMFSDLFEAFVSGKAHGGIGIGLNIAQRIIHDQRGEIRAYNENGGAVFEVVLPVASKV